MINEVITININLKTLLPFNNQGKEDNRIQNYIVLLKTENADGYSTTQNDFTLPDNKPYNDIIENTTRITFIKQDSDINTSRKFRINKAGKYKIKIYVALNNGSKYSNEILVDIKDNSRLVTPASLKITSSSGFTQHRSTQPRVAISSKLGVQPKPKGLKVPEDQSSASRRSSTSEHSSQSRPWAPYSTSHDPVPFEKIKPVPEPTETFPPPTKGITKTPLPEKIYQPILTHQNTFIVILDKLPTSGNMLPTSLKKNTNTWSPDMPTEKTSLFKDFFIPHRSESPYIVNSDANGVLKKLLLKAPKEVEQGNKEIQEDPNNKTSFANLFQNFFNLLYISFQTTYGNRTPRIFIKFIYDFIKGYVGTYAYRINEDNVSNDVRITTGLFYNTFFKRYIGSTAKTILNKNCKLEDDAQIEKSILEYVIHNKIPDCLEKKGGYIEFDDNIINLEDVIDLE